MLSHLRGRPTRQIHRDTRAFRARERRYSHPSSGRTRGHAPPMMHMHICVHGHGQHMPGSRGVGACFGAHAAALTTVGVPSSVHVYACRVAPAPASANDPASALASEATSDCVAAQALAAAADVEGTAGKGSDDADGHVRWAQSKGRKQPPQTPTQRPLPPPKPHQNRCAVRKTAAALAAAHDDEAATAAMA